MYSYIYFLRCVNISISLSNSFLSIYQYLFQIVFYDLILIHTDRCVTSVMAGSFLPTFRRLSRLLHILEFTSTSFNNKQFSQSREFSKKTKKKRRLSWLKVFFPTFSVLKCLSRLVHILEKRSPSGKE